MLLLLRQLLFSNTEGSVGSCVAIIVILSVVGNNIYGRGWVDVRWSMVWRYLVRREKQPITTINNRLPANRTVCAGLGYFLFGHRSCHPHCFDSHKDGRAHRSNSAWGFYRSYLNVWTFIGSWRHCSQTQGDPCLRQTQSFVNTGKIRQYVSRRAELAPDIRFRN